MKLYILNCSSIPLDLIFLILMINVYNYQFKTTRSKFQLKDSYFLFISLNVKKKLKKYQFIKRLDAGRS
jgi:hypothetical protein